MRAVTGLLMVVMLHFCVAPVRAHSTSGSEARAGAKRGVLKDCPRFNGRHGYYGNPWCSEAEQRAWDLATGRQPSRLNVER